MTELERFTGPLIYLLFIFYGIVIGVREGYNTKERWSPYPIAVSDNYHNWRFAEWCCVFLLAACDITLWPLLSGILVAWGTYEWIHAIVVGKDPFKDNPTDLKVFGASIHIPWQLPASAIALSVVIRVLISAGLLKP